MGYITHCFGANVLLSIETIEVRSAKKDTLRERALIGRCTAFQTYTSAHAKCPRRQASLFPSNRIQFVHNTNVRRSNAHQHRYTPIYLYICRLNVYCMRVCAYVAIYSVPTENRLSYAKVKRAFAFVSPFLFVVDDLVLSSIADCLTLDSICSSKGIHRRCYRTFKLICR